MATRGKKASSPLGTHSSLLAVKIPYVMNQTLEVIAGGKDKVPDLIRRIILIHTFPYLFKASQLDIKNRPGSDSNERFIYLANQIRYCKMELDKLITSCDSVDKIREKAESLKVRLDTYQLEADKYITQLEFEVEKEFPKKEEDISISITELEAVEEETK